MAGAFVPKSDLSLVPERSDRFAFNSRRYGLALLGALGTRAVAIVILLVYRTITQPDAANEILTNEPVSVALGAGISIAYVASIVAFLIWVYKLHQDLGRLSPTYPYSPTGAVARVATPVYNIYGVWRVFATLNDNWAVGLRYWLGLYYILSFATWRRVFFTSGIPEQTYYLLMLGATVVCFIMTLQVHRALAGMIDEAIAFPLAASQINETKPVVSLAEQTSDALEPGNAPDGPTLPPYVPKKHRNTGLGIAIGVGALAFFACFISAVAVFIPLLRQWGETSSELNLYDENFDQLVEALDDRWGPDDTIPSASVDFFINQYPDGTSAVSLVIDLETTESCTTLSDDPCLQLAEELAAIALREYPRIDEMDGMRVAVTHYYLSGPVTLEIGVDHTRTINEWRRRLGPDPKESLRFAPFMGYIVALPIASA